VEKERRGRERRAGRERRKKNRDGAEGKGKGVDIERRKNYVESVISHAQLSEDY
jgi:hypothetical protein